MYIEHPLFIAPDDPEVKIWRYMSISKFISMINTKALFFSRADKFDDKFEGSYSHANIDLRPIVYNGKIPPSARDQLSDFSKHMLRYTIINCWHINENESAAMWKLYCSDDEGIAIQSTYHRLLTSFDDNPDDSIHIGKVLYINYDTDWLPEGNSLYPFVHKRQSFEHERELRAIIQKLPTSKEGIDFSKDLFDYGKNVDVKIDNLIEKIYVSPNSKTWFVEIVEEIVRKFNLQKVVKYSDLSKDPVY